MHRRRLYYLLCAISSLFWAGRWGWAQTGDIPSANRPPHIRVDVDLVLLEAQVIDQKGKPAHFLTADDFRIYEDGVLQEITVFSLSPDHPVSLAILLDNSQGMTEGPFRTAKQAIRHLIHLLRPEDEIMLATYHKDFFVEQNFTTNRQRISHALDNIYLRAPAGKLAGALGTLFGGEATYTGLGIDLALMKLRERRPARKALLVLSNRFTGMGPATTDHARNAEIPMYALSFKNVGWDLMSLGGDHMALKDTVVESGGHIYNVQAQKLEDTMHTLAYALKNYYQIGYTPSNKIRDGRVRKIRVETIDKDLIVHTRRSYAPPASSWSQPGRR